MILFLDTFVLISVRNILHKLNTVLPAIFTSSKRKQIQLEERVRGEERRGEDEERGGEGGEEERRRGEEK